MTTEDVFRLLALGLLLSALTIGGYFRRKSEREGGRLKTREGQGLLIVLRGLALVIIAPLFVYFLNPAWVAWARAACTAASSAAGLWPSTLAMTFQP